MVVVGGGITGLVTSYYLTMDGNTRVTLLEKNKSILSEASGHDVGFLMNNNISYRTFGSLPMGKLSSLNRVDGPNSVYTTHIALEPGLIKFTWHWLLYQFRTRNRFSTRQSIWTNAALADLSKQSH